MVCYLLFAVARDAHSTHTAHLPTWKPLRDEPSGTQDCSLLLLAEDLVELLAVEVELAAKDLLVNRELAGTGHREVAQDEHVHGRKLEVVRVRLRDAKREVLDARVEQVEDDGGDHRGRHRGSSRAREQADGQQAGTRDLRGSGRQGPELRRAWEEAKELGDNVGGEAIDVLDLVEAVVHHERAGAEAQGGDAKVDDRLRGHGPGDGASEEGGGRGGESGEEDGAEHGD